MKGRGMWEEEGREKGRDEGRESEGRAQKKRWSIQARPLEVTIQPVVKEEDFWM